MRIESREPLTREEIEEILQTKVDAEAKHWGEDYFYTECARKRKVDLLRKFDAGEIIPVENFEYCESYGNGTGDFMDTLYSDGHVETTCYGYSD